MDQVNTNLQAESLDEITRDGWRVIALRQAHDPFYTWRWLLPPEAARAICRMRDDGVLLTVQRREIGQDVLLAKLTAVRAPSPSPGFD
jgi:hypothetical protein